jgi:hypothetical protein
MSNRLVYIRYRLYALALLGVLSSIIAHLPSAKGADVSGTCSKDQTLQVCVVSAALTGAAWHGEGQDRRGLTVSVTLGASNTTDFPIGLALMGRNWGAWSLTPQNAEAIMNQGDWKISGIKVCSDTRKCDYTTLSPGMSLLVQIRYRGVVSTAGLPLIEIASTAAFTTSMILVERGTPRLVSYALSGFTFGNAIRSTNR